MLPTIWHPGNGKTMETIKRSVFPGLDGRVGYIGRAQRIFRATKLLVSIM